MECDQKRTDGGVEEDDRIDSSGFYVEKYVHRLNDICLTRDDIVASLCWVTHAAILRKDEI